MTKDELIKLDMRKVRNTPDLMRIYMELFYEQFGYRPNCAGCSFSSDWHKLVSSGQTSKGKEMIDTNKTFILYSHTPNIIAYRENGIQYRVYSRKVGDDYMNKYLSIGTPEEIAERKKYFKKLPDTQEVVKKKRGRKPKNG